MSEIITDSKSGFFFWGVDESGGLNTYIKQLEKLKCIIGGCCWKKTLINGV